MLRPLLFLAASAFLICKPLSADAQSLDAVRAAGVLRCATVQSVDDWNGQDQHGDLSAFGTELCRAIATGIFGNQAKVAVTAFPAELEALDALKTGSVDVAVGLSPSAANAVQYGVSFGRPIFFDTERLMVPEQGGIKTVDGLRDKLICAMNNTPAERTLRDEMTARGIPYGLQAHSEQGEMDASVAVARCAAGAALESRLAESRADFPANAPPFVFLPERFGLSPVVAAWHAGDQKLGLLVDATINALIEAEALGITHENVGETGAHHDMRTDRLIGADRSIGQSLGLRADWAVPVIAAVGNYGEVFDRTIGKPYRLERGLNALWTAGGLMYPMPMQ